VFDAATDKNVARYWANNPENVSKAIEWSPDFWGAPSPAGNSTNEEYAQEKLNALLAQ
jgi:putative spermidine/putrescine transport system substrate-binding protein